MKAGKRCKSTEEKLTPSQVSAVESAEDNDYWPLMQEIRKIDRTIKTIMENTQMGTEQWSHSMIRHYVEIGEFLLSKLTDRVMHDALCRNLDHLEGR